MKRMMKNILVMMLAASMMAMYLAGCGSSDAKNNSTSDASAQESSKTEEVSAVSEESPEESNDEVSAEQTESNDTAEDGYGFIYFQVGEYVFSLKTPIDEVIANIGEPMDTFVTSSCAYQGDDYMYYFDGFEVVANTADGDENRITTITLDDDTVKTPQGVKIGMNIDDALALMGEEYTSNNNVYTFVSGFAMLRFQVGNDNCIKAIQYMLAEQ